MLDYVLFFHFSLLHRRIFNGEKELLLYLTLQCRKEKCKDVVRFFQCVYNSFLYAWYFWQEWGISSFRGVTTPIPYLSVALRFSLKVNVLCFIFANFFIRVSFSSTTFHTGPTRTVNTPVSAHIRFTLLTSNV